MSKEKLVPKLRFSGFDDEWGEVKLGEIFDIKNGLNKGKEFFGKGIQILNYMDVNKHEFNTEKMIEGLVELTEDEIERFSVKPNDLFFTRTSETSDEIGLTSAYIGNEVNCVFSGFILRARPKIGLNSLFYAYYFRSPQQRNNIIKYSSITTRALISGANLSKMKIRLPQAEEQNNIAKFLQIIDKKIELLEKKHQYYQDFKKYLMQQIFAQKLRFADYNDAWKEVTLKDIGTFYRGHSYNSTNVVDNGLLVLRSNNIQNNVLDFSEDGLQFVDKECKKELELQKNDIVICMSNGTRSLVGKSAEYTGNYANKLTVGAFCSIFRTKNKLAKYLFQTENYKKNLYLILAGTNINNLKNTDLEKFKFNIPVNESEINKIHDLFTSIDNKIESNQKQLQEIIVFKKGLLQQMFVYIYYTHQILNLSS